MKRNEKGEILKVPQFWGVWETKGNSSILAFSRFNSGVKFFWSNVENTPPHPAPPRPTPPYVWNIICQTIWTFLHFVERRAAVFLLPVTFPKSNKKSGQI